jgi:hypothetical protein
LDLWIGGGMSRPYQIFIGCPFTTTIRRTYDRLKKEIEAETPLQIVIADTAAVSSTNYLLGHITDLIRESITCIFDITGNNPNVSLEVGIAHAIPTDYLITLNTRKPKKIPGKKKEDTRIKSIISDLQGKNRIEYKTYDRLKEQIMSRHLNHLDFMKRWTNYKRGNYSHVPHAIQVFADIRTSTRSVSPRISAILSGSGIKPTEFIRFLKKAKLLSAREGKGGGYYYPAK